MRVLALLATVVLTTVAAIGGDGVAWLSVDEAVARSKNEPRPILVDVYTGWCGWCKRMDKSTYADSAIVAYINRTFWAIKFDAEQKDSLVFNGRVFRYVTERKAHEFALSLLSEQMSYPSTVFLNPDFSMIQPIAGYLDPASMAPILAYIGEGANRTTEWKDFQRTFSTLPK